MISTCQMRKSGHKEVKYLGQGYTANKWGCQASNQADSLQSLACNHCTILPQITVVEPQVLFIYNLHISRIHWSSSPLSVDGVQRYEREGIFLFLTLLPIGYGSACPCQAGAGVSPHLAGVPAALWVASTQHPWQ